MFKFTYLLLFFVFKFLIMNGQDTLCKTRYPLVLVHGIGFKDNIIIKPYWGRIPENLQKNGAAVYLANVDGLGTIENNAVQLKKIILEIVETTNCEKVNIIAHSKGGIDTRYMISKLDMEKHVASASLIASPNRGTVWADLGLYSIERFKIKKIVEKISIFYAKILNDKNPEPMIAYNQFKTNYMEDYTNILKDKEGVYYQSFGTYLKPDYPSLMMRYRRKNIHKYAGENDGVIPLSSTKWTNFTVIGEDSKYGISHFDIIDFTKNIDFDVIFFYNSLVNNLKNKGF